MALTFYDQAGTAVAYSQDEEHIYLFSGRAAGYIRGRNVYGYDGGHIGVFVNGWVWDHGGLAVFFTERARGGPMRPVRSVKPVKSVRSVRPVKSVRAVAPVASVRSLGWSRQSGERFFG